MRNHKFHLQIFTYYDLDGMDQHLEAMAAQGWMLEKISTFGWHYRRIGPKRLRFSVTYQDSFSFWDAKNDENQQAYQDLCQSSGWKLAAAKGPIQIFYTEDEDTPPIETDPQMVLSAMDRLSRSSQTFAVMMLVTAFLNGLQLVDGLRQFPIWRLASPTSLIVSLCWVLTGLYCAIDLITYHLWRHRAKRAAAMGEFVQARNRRSTSMQFFVAILVMTLLYVLPASRLPHYRMPLAILAALLALFLIVPTVVRHRRKRRGSVSIRWTVLANASSSLLVIATLALFLVYLLMGNPSFTEERTDLDPPLTAADLIDVDDARYVHEVRIDRSVLVHHSVWDVSADGGLPTLYYEIADVQFAPVYDLCRDSLLHPEYGEDPALLDPVRGVDAVYQDADGRRSYVFCWDTRLVELHAEWSLTEEQLATAARLLAP